MKITFRKAKPSDMARWFKVLNKMISEKKAPFINKTDPLTKKEMENRAQQIAKGESLSFIAKLNGKIIAQVGMQKYKGRTAHRVHMGWFVDPDYWNKGVMSQLLKYTLKELKKLGFKRAECEVVPSNKASIRVVEKAGFKREGIKKKAFRLDSGKYADIYIYGRLI